MTSKKKKRTNQENARKSTGPKSQEGKETSSQNSLKHGIWAKQLTISPAETADYGKLINDLDALLKPKGPILQYYFDEIVLCMWRLKKLVTFGNPQFHAWDSSPLLTESEPQEFGTSRSEFEEKLKSSDKLTLKEQERVLGWLEGSISRGGYLSAEEKEYLAKVFGRRFVEELETILPTGYEATGTSAADMMDGKFKTYPPPKDFDGPNMPRTIFVKELLLEVIRGRKEKTASQRAGNETIKNKVPSPDLLALSVDLQLRYSAALKRDLKKAIDAYFHYKPVASQKSGQ
jgi:hypothetical protein